MKKLVMLVSLALVLTGCSSTSEPTKIDVKQVKLVKKDIENVKNVKSKIESPENITHIEGFSTNPFDPIKTINEKTEYESL